MPSSERVLTFAAIVLAGVASSANASATPNFPAFVQKRFSMPAPPDCTLCHQGPTQRGTVTTPLGESLRSRGLVAYDEASLGTALGALAGEKKDSDGDGIPDTDELTNGTDPNVSASDPTADVPVPDYGCGVSSSAPAEGVTASFGILAVLAALGAIATRRTRTRRIASLAPKRQDTSGSLSAWFRARISEGSRHGD
ncbi:MAG: thrombospondin type 3 repeat-containing protein [Polyangiaceae bacterium]